MKTSTIALAAVLGAQTAPTFANTIGSERADIWALLSEIQIEEVVSDTSYRVNKTWPKGLSGDLENVEITGYAVPMFPGDSVKELILSSDVGFCPLCGSPDHGATLQVTLDDPIPGFEDGQRITLTGTLERVEDSETWQAAHLTSARVVVR